jgi:nitrile hydratase subunit beta
MSEKPVNRGPHDMGGEAAGPIDTTDHGMRFWEKQANAMRSVLNAKKVVRTDELRRGAEALGERYYQLAYFERTTEALRTLLLEKGIVTEAGLKAKMAAVRKRFDVPPESASPVKKRARP